MIIHEGDFLNKIKKGLKTYSKPEKPKEFEGTESISEKDFNKIIADINSIGSQYEKLCNKYDMSLVIHSSLDQAKKDFKAGKSAGLKASYTFAGGTYYDSFPDKETWNKFAKELNDFLHGLGFSNVNVENGGFFTKSSKYPNISIELDYYDDVTLCIYGAKSKYKKSESVKESGSFLDKVVFEESNLLEGKFFDYITRNSPYNVVKRRIDFYDQEQKTRDLIDRYDREGKEIENAVNSIKYKNFTKEEVNDIVKQIDKASKALIRWFNTIKPKIKIKDFDLGTNGYTYEYGDYINEKYTLTQYLSDTKRKYNDPEENDLGDVGWYYAVKWTKDPELTTEEYYKDIEAMKLGIENEFKKFIKANGFKEESVAFGRIIGGYGSSKFPNICITYNIKDDEFAIFVDCKED